MWGSGAGFQGDGPPNAVLNSRTNASKNCEAIQEQVLRRTVKRLQGGLVLRLIDFLCMTQL